MAIYNTGAVVRVVVEGLWLDVVETVNVFELKLVAGTGLSSAEVWADARDYMDDAFSIIAAQLNAGMVFQGVRVSQLNGVDVSGLIPFAATIDGALTTDPVPSGVAALVSFPTGVSRVVPRKYIPGADESRIDAVGQFGATMLTAMGTFGVQLLAAQVMTNGTWQFGYQSPKTSNFEIPYQVIASAVPAYQRRRRPGTGS